ncbi:hypothetical protein Q6D67_16085 [Haliea sp. E1-2-M8]|uniref:hypothetical protein n=1 Tax=Haliea sp. E1-2-M8 TaxID=3064706 RepID=UPI00271B895C|nr:hypothetical protein [Haliea sp. E1-2-M8]MDO8863226.1 hypothetical protein [Haliea sp. E1-2-M8]
MPGVYGWVDFQCREDNVNAFREFIKFREGVSQGIKGSQQCQQPAFTDRFHDQSVPLLVDDCFIALELELARDAQCLVAPIAKEAHVTFRS